MSIKSTFNKLTFNEAKEKNLSLLEQYVPVVAKVHGKNHPEFYDVKDEYNILVEKINEAGSKKPELDEEFSKLREISDNYSVPEDACETYEAVYNMLEELDKAYYN